MPLLRAGAGGIAAEKEASGRGGPAVHLRAVRPCGTNSTSLTITAPIGTLKVSVPHAQAVRYNNLVNRPMTNRVSYTLESTLESVNQCEQTASQMAARAGFAEDEQYQVA